MLTEKQKSLLEYVKDVPEWQAGLIYEQLAFVNKAVAFLANTAARLEQGFADSSLRPDKYHWTDRATRKDWNTGTISNAASAMGSALAALEVLAVLADAYRQDFQHDVEFAHDLRYKELEKLCIKHGYIEEENA